MKQIIEIVNQLFALETKVEKDGNTAKYGRHLQRMKQAMEDMGYSYHSPEGEKYSETRTDIEATITGEPTDNMTIVQVIKPIIMQTNQIVQTGIVIVEGK
jgi:hypothetical protein